MGFYPSPAYNSTGSAREAAMQKRQLKRVLLGSAVVLGFSLAAWQSIEACTRVVYIGTDGIVITGRSMDWVEDMSSNLWAFPRGIKRDGAAGRIRRAGSPSTAVSSSPVMKPAPPMA
jgi:penicillin V acylase-like amidase (Ntn superfamily)